jgi:hypothetical protein
VQVQHVREKNVTWREFKRHFEKKYLTKRYYDKKMKDFFKLKLGSMSIDEYERIFLELLKYVPFIKEETVNIQRYLSGLPSSNSDKIQYDDLKTMEETIRREKCLYDQQKEKPTVSNISCIGVFSSLILGLWCKRIKVGFENRLDVFYSRAATISVERNSQKKSISGLKSSEQAV